MNRREIKNISLICYERKYKANEVIFKKGYPNVVFYILKKGLLRVHLQKNDKHLQLATVKPFEYIGEMGLFMDEKRTANVTAVEDSVLIAISKEEFKKFIDTYPRSGLKILYKFGEILAGTLLKYNTLREEEKI